MFPYMTPDQVRLENQRLNETTPDLNEQVRAELEARQFEEAESSPAPKFGFRPTQIKLWPHPVPVKATINRK